MKKFISIIALICMIFSVQMSVFGAENVIKVQYDSETKEYTSFEEGWNHAMDKANDGKEVYVTLLADWNAKDGQFTEDFFNGPGFDWDAIYFDEYVKITLDLNGFTIDRGLTSSELNGEVMFIDDHADVTIKNGTISGGYSNNGAGGIHIENATVHITNVTFTGNSVRDDDGTAIQHNDGGNLYLTNCVFEGNNGSDSGLDIYGTVFLDGMDNAYIENCTFKDTINVDYGAGIHADDCDYIEIKNCRFENLHAGDRGGAIWAGGRDSRIDIRNCTFKDNSCGNWGGAICTDQIELYVYDSEFINNSADWDGGAVYLDVSAGSDGFNYFYRCNFDGNSAGWDGGAIYCNSNTRMAHAETYGCTFKNNSAKNSGGAVFFETECKFALYSDENGNPAVIKNNTAGEHGGGVYAGYSAGVGSAFTLGGEVYISGNTSSHGDDDVYVLNTYCVYYDDITSPAGSIGIRKSSDSEGNVGIFKEGAKQTAEPFFVNNEGFEPEVDAESGMLRIVEKSSAVGSLFGSGNIGVILCAAGVAAAGIAIITITYKKKKA